MDEPSEKIRPVEDWRQDFGQMLKVGPAYLLQGELQAYSSRMTACNKSCGGAGRDESPLCRL